MKVSLGSGLPSVWRSSRRAATRYVLAALVLLTAAVPLVVERTLAQEPSLRMAGPVDPVTGYPAWYQDAVGLRLQPCLDNSGNCLGVLPNPDAPPSTPANMPDEHFYFSAGAEGLGTHLVEFALEAAFANEAVVYGDQQTFTRLRLRFDGVLAGATYTVTHPWGVHSVVAAASGDRGVNETIDLMCTPAPECNWNFPLTSPIASTFLTWDTFGLAPSAGGPPVGYIGDPNVPHRVVGSPLGQNFVRIDGPNIGGPGINTIRTELFTVEGKLAGVNVRAVPKGGLFNAEQSVQLVPSDPDATIYYTLDGSDPSNTANGQRTQYSGALLLNQDTRLRFYAESIDPNGFRPPAKSVVVTEDYAFDFQAPALTLSPDGGFFNDTTNVTVTASEPGTTIWYTLNEGGDPRNPLNRNRREYTAPIAVSVTTTIRVAGEDEAGNWSPLTAKLFTIDTTPPPLPTLTLVRASDSGAADFLTNINLPEFTGTAEKSTTINLILNDTAVIGTAETRTVGTFTITPSAPIPDGVHTIRAQAVDKAGNSSAATDPAIALTVDTVPPVLAVTSGPAAEVTDPATPLTFAFIHREAIAAGLGWQCSLSSGGTETFAPCVSPLTLPMQKNGAYTFKAQAQDRARNVGTALYAFTINVPPPTVSAAPEITRSREPITVALTASPAAAKIYFTTDGSTPAATEAQLYAAPFVVSSTTTVKFVAIDALGNASELQTKQYVVDTQAPVVGLTPAPGVYNTAISVTMTPDEEGSSIYFTTDGNAPEAGNAAQKYTGPIGLAAGDAVTLQFISVDDLGNTSGVVTGQYDFDVDPPTVTMTPSTGLSNAPVAVTLASDEPGTVHYTLDGSTPTAGSPQAPETLTIAESTTVKAIAIDRAGNVSPVAEGSFVIDTVAPVAKATPAGKAFTGPLQVELGLATPDETARIFYTTGEGEPETEYTGGGLVLNETTTLRFLARDGAGNTSAIAAETYTFDGEAPSVAASPAGKAYNAAQRVTLTSADATAAIYYTTNGDEPTTSSSRYTDTIAIGADTTLKFAAFDAAGNTSGVQTEQYVIDTVQPVVSVSVEGGLYNQALTVELRSTKAGTIYYTLNGDMPTRESAQMAPGGELPITSSTTVKFFAVDTVDNVSPVMTATYTIDRDAPDAEALPPAGTYSAAQRVVLRSGDAEAVIHYTTDGEAPTTASPAYSGEILVDRNLSVRFFSVDRAGNRSAVQTASYVLDTVKPVVTMTPAAGTHQSVQVALSATKSASLRYTLDGAEPTPSSGTPYTGAFALPANATTTVKAVAFDAIGNVSDVVTRTFTTDSAAPAAPAADPVAGLYSSAQSVSLTAEAGATVRYTTGANDDVSTWQVYSGAIQVASTATLRFVAVDAAGNVSPAGTAEYTIDTVAPVASASPAGGLFNAAQTVRLSSTKSGALYYTTDNSTPTRNSTPFNGSIAIGSTTTLKFIAVDTAGNVSEVVTETYTIDTAAPAVSASPAGGTYASARTVALTSESGAVIRYTTNGSDPTGSSPQYTAALTIDRTTVLKFFAQDQAGNRSGIVTEAYTIQVTVPNVLNQSEAQARAAMTALGLTVTLGTPEYHATIASGRVISTSPAADANVAPGSPVTLVLSRGPAPVAVPNVVGQQEAAAVSSLTGLGLQATVSRVNNAAPSGQVIAQNPASGASVLPGAQVALTVSSGLALVAVPNVVGQQETAAVSSLTGLGLQATVSRVNNAAPSGQVIAQNPPSGTGVLPGSQVALTVSSGPAVAEDTTPPSVTAPVQSIDLDSVLATVTVPVTLTWTGTDTSGVTGYQVQRSANGGASYATVASPASPLDVRHLNPNTTVWRYRVNATDARGNTSGWAEGPAFTVTPSQENATTIAYTGAWSTAALTNAYGGSTRSASVSGARAAFTFTGSHIAWVAPKNNARGIAEVWVDGALAATVDLYSASTLYRRVVFTRALAQGTHTIEIRVTGRRNAASTGTRVDLDAFVVINTPGAAASTVAVPNVVGDARAAAESEIAAAGLAVGTVGTASSTSVPSGSVISQSPAAGSNVAPGTAVSFVVSSGAPLVTVPNVVGQAGTAAQTTLSGLGLSVSFTDQNNAAPAGSIISQNPAAGASVPAGTTVALVRSLGPVTAGDTTPPTVTAPVHAVALDSVLATTTVPVLLTWSGADPSGIASYELQRSANGGASYSTLALPSPTATSFVANLNPNSTVWRYQVRATDTRGNVSTFAVGAPFTITPAQESSTSIAYTGAWTTAALTNAYGGSTRSASAAGARAAFSFTGNYVSWVAPKGVDRGRAEVWIDGVRVATVDLYSASTQYRRVVFSQALNAGQHTIEVRVLGTRSAAATGTRVDVDAFVTFR